MTEPHYIIRMLWSIKLLVDIYATHSYLKIIVYLKYKALSMVTTIGM